MSEDYIQEITKDTPLVYTSEEQLSYKDDGGGYVNLYVDGELVGYIEVWQDGYLEYIIINNQPVYLDTIKAI